VGRAKEERRASVEATPASCLLQTIKEEGEKWGKSRRKKKENRPSILPFFVKSIRKKGEDWGERRQGRSYRRSPLIILSASWGEEKKREEEGIGWAGGKQKREVRAHHRNFFISLKHDAQRREEGARGGGKGGKWEKKNEKDPPSDSLYYLYLSYRQSLRKKKEDIPKRSAKRKKKRKKKGIRDGLIVLTSPSFKPIQVEKKKGKRKSGGDTKKKGKGWRNSEFFPTPFSPYSRG